MKIGMLGYGKMGKAIEKVALDRGHELTLKINSSNAKELSPDLLKDIDVAIEFSTPEAALSNIKLCLENQIPIIIGTTGWYEHLDEVKKLRESKNGSMITATNFSVGVNLFFELNRKLARLMNTNPEYKVALKEIHHTEKLDSPSGTAISIAEQVIENHNSYTQWVNEKTNGPNVLGIESLREEDVKGTHIVQYDSPIDSIQIEHFAKNRTGFALGAVLAAEFILHRTGIYTMNDVLNIKS